MNHELPQFNTENFEEEKPEPGRSALRLEAYRLRDQLLAIEDAVVRLADGRVVLKNLNNLKKSDNPEIARLAKDLIDAREKWRYSR